MTDELDDYRRQVEALRKENVYLRKSFERNIRLHELFQEMLRLSDKEQIYFFIADNLARLFPKSIILFNSIDEPRNISKLEVIRGIGDSLFKKILDVLRFNPVGKEYPLVQNHHDYCRTGKLVEFKNGLEEFSASELSPFIARTVEVMLNIHKIYTVGLMRENQLHATIHIFTRSDAVIDDIEFVEMFVQQSGILLQKMMAETELRESELRFKALHNASFGGIAIHEMGRIYDCNQGMADMTGYSLDELIGMDGMLLLTEPSRKIVMDNILSGYEKPYEAMGLRKNGETYHLQLEGRNIPYKGRMMRSVEFRDITRQKELELALQQQKSFFEQMFVQSNTSTQILDPEGWCVRINARLGELFGVQPEAMEGRKYNIFQDGEVQRQGIDEKLRRLIREKKAQSWEVNFDIGEASESQQIEIKERKKAWFSNTAYPILGVDGELMNIIIQHDDITTRKLAEEKIRKSEEQLRIISENAADVIWEMDPEAGRFTYVSPSVFALRGYTAEEVMNMPVSASLTPESNEYINVSMRTSVPEFLSSGKESFTHLHEVDQPRKDGTIVQTEVTTTLMLSPEGRLKIIGISRDITKRKEAERKFRESEERFRKAFLTSPDAFNINRLEDGLYVNINRGFTNITGYTEEDAIGKTSAEVNIWVDFNDRKKLVEGLKKEGVYINLAAKFRKKDGTIATGLMSASVIDLNGVPHILSMTRDISELRRIQDALQENEALFRRIFQEGLISMVICDEKFRFTRVNDAYCRMLGYSEKELLQLSFPEVTHPDHLKEDMGFAEKMRNGEIATYHTEKRYLHRSGAIIWGSSNISVMRDAEGKFLYFLAMVDNVTEKKKLIDELIHAKEKAEESERLKSAFLANMSHEIRTPMNGILGFAGLLKEPNLSGEEQQTYLNLIEKSGERMLNIINDLINISKVEAGQMEVYYTETNLHEQFEFLYNFFQPEAKRKGLKLVLSNLLTNKQALVITDKEKLYAILTNLIKNAVKFTKEGYIEFGCIYKSGSYRFFVKDTGIGIAADKQAAVFERFFQADTHMSRGYEGAGLGLAISKAYVEMMGGKIWLESATDEGTCFYFTLPDKKNLSETQVATQPQPTSLNPSNCSDCHVLIVDDDEPSVLYLKGVLKNMPVKIMVAGTGEEAIEMVRNHQTIQLVLMDIQMPVMDGYLAADEIKKIRPELPVVAQTAYSMEIDSKRGKNNFVAYMTKPLLTSDLKKIFAKYLNN